MFRSTHKRISKAAGAPDRDDTSTPYNLNSNQTTPSLNIKEFKSFSPEKANFDPDQSSSNLLKIAHNRNMSEKVNLDPEQSSSNLLKIAHNRNISENTLKKILYKSRDKLQKPNRSIQGKIDSLVHMEQEQQKQRASG